jgi:hypothetical protein
MFYAIPDILTQKHLKKWKYYTKRYLVMSNLKSGLPGKKVQDLEAFIAGAMDW